MLQKEQILLIIYFTLIILFFIIFGVIFFIAFQKRKNKLILENLNAQRRFDDELVKSKLEIQEQTLKNVSWELHDNIGQLLSTAVMQMNMLRTNHEEQLGDSINDVRSLVTSSLQEIRSLSKTLNHEVIQNVGIESSIKVELRRFEKLNFLKTTFEVTGKEYVLNPKDEIILYRIIQEFFSNTIKHAEAENLFVSIHSNYEALNILIKDDGIGFDTESVVANSGLLNMRSRAALVNASLEIVSQLNQGTELNICYPLINQNLSDNS
ncbi:sensor histidine kinase [Aquimarina sp. W85]|uniref:sensor histidine kinase n=1 Tax=Aquimarina rhodophyticola TaxID=3342246 RepID=UPI0036709A13